MDLVHIINACCLFSLLFFILLCFCSVDSQWFGVDIGGSLVKCVYFECPSANGSNQKETEGIAAMREFLKSNLKYGSSGKYTNCLLKIVIK